jgi:outer membrane lipoprotein-sorting protein
VQAIGGTAAIQKLRTRIEQGKVSFGPRQFSWESFIKSPDKTIVTTHLPNGDNLTVYDGHEGWSSAPGRPLHQMSVSEATAASLDADLQFPADAKKVFKEMRVEREEKLGDHTAYVIVGAREGQPPTRLYFDEQSSLLVRQVRYADSPLGLNPTQVDYSGYRDQGGVKMPFHLTISQPRGSSAIQIDQIQLNVPIDDSKFAKPVVAPNPEKR